MNAESLANGRPPAVPWRLTLPEDPDREMTLCLKLNEYDMRLASASYKGLDAPGAYALRVRREVLHRVIMSSEPVLARDVYADMAAEPGFNEFDTDEALRVIDDYCRTGGKNLEGGTGLPDPAQHRINL